MKKTGSFVVAVLCVVLLFSACDTCGTPATTPLKPGDDAWVPYELGNILRFTDSTNTDITYTCTSAATTYVAAEGQVTADKCIEKQSTQVSCIIQDTKNMYPPMGMFILRSSDAFTVQVAVEGHGSWNLDVQNPTYPLLVVNGNAYTSVFEVKPDSTKPSDLKQLLYSKEAGFISATYHDGRALTLSALSN